MRPIPRPRFRRAKPQPSGMLARIDYAGNESHEVPILTLECLDPTPEEREFARRWMDACSSGGLHELERSRLANRQLLAERRAAHTLIERMTDEFGRCVDVLERYDQAGQRKPRKVLEELRELLQGNVSAIREP